MKRSTKQVKITVDSIIFRHDQGEERLSEMEDMIKGYCMQMITKNTYDYNIKNTGKKIKRPTLRIYEVEEGAEIQIKRKPIQ
jgi:hypothetical protein